MKQYFSTTDTIVITLTFLLFIISVFVKGLTQHILIEIAVLLVSIKLIRIGYKNSVSDDKILKELKDIKNKLKDKQS